MNASFHLFDTAVGRCGLAWRGPVLIGCQLPEDGDEATRLLMARRFPQAQEQPIGAALEPVAALAVRRLQGLLAGTADDLRDLPLELDGVAPFERRVYEVTRAIAVGRTMTYGEVARAIGEPGAARAVGRALGRNPFAPIIPCHRVLAAGARSGGFSAGGGVATKLRLLLIERARFGQEPELFERAQ